MHTLWIALRTLAYAVILVGPLVWLAYEAHLQPPPLGVPLPGWIGPVGVILMPIGAALALWSATIFVVRGRGTPAPFDAPRVFVASGPYRYVRNPMAIGVLLALTGYALFTVSSAALLVPAGLLVALQFFVVLYEEPTLERRFGDSYREYRQLTPRWIPRL